MHDKKNNYINIPQKIAPFVDVRPRLTIVCIAVSIATKDEYLMNPIELLVGSVGFSDRASTVKM